MQFCETMSPDSFCGLLQNARQASPIVSKKEEGENENPDLQLLLIPKWKNVSVVSAIMSSI